MSFRLPFGSAQGKLLNDEEMEAERSRSLKARTIDTIDSQESKSKWLIPEQKPEMKNHYDLSDQEFIRAFEQCILEPSYFNHEAHLRLAWLHLNRTGLERSVENMQKHLKRYVAHWGAKEKYNTTLTVASVKAVYHFMSKSTSKTFNDFIIEFPRLKYQFQELLRCHYKTDIFNSEAVKAEYLEPELLPFD